MDMTMPDPIFLPAPADRAAWDNWRTFPFSAHGFTHVSQILPVAPIRAPAEASMLAQGPSLPLSDIAFELESGRMNAAAFLRENHSQGIIVLRKGRVLAEHYGHGQAASDQHIVFSVTKSVTALLAGILASQGKLDPDAPVPEYLPAAAGSAYGDCTVQHLLDMQVAIRFIEDYLDPAGDVARYRVATGYNPPGDVRFEGGTRDFVLSLPRDAGAHGREFSYVSPNIDCLGLVLEAAGGMSFAAMLEQFLWQPMGAGADAAITVDRFGAPRTAGGMLMQLRDMARLGELVRCRGNFNGHQIVPEAWIDDLWHGGSPAAWQAAGNDMTIAIPNGRYRSCWYALGDAHDCLCAIGIHGQWIYIDPVTETVIARQSCQPLASDRPLYAKLLRMFAAISAS
jgi:CubicO group peptidase (beta-lactamase class C family)